MTLKLSIVRIKKSQFQLLESRSNISQNDYRKFISHIYVFPQEDLRLRGTEYRHCGLRARQRQAQRKGASHESYHE